MHIAQEIARHHHERWDGSGYPDRLAATAIPIAARVSALADVFDALTHKRPYKEAWPVADALAEIKRLRGRQFDPELTDVFLELVPRLQREHGDLDRFLAEEAKHSPFIQARERIARALKGSNPEVSVFELRR
jgi:putative two-component system response regulator